MNFERQELLYNLKKQLAEYVPPFEDWDKHRSISPSFNYDEKDLKMKYGNHFHLMQNILSAVWEESSMKVKSKNKKMKRQDM